MLGLLLARGGIDVVVLEKHGDFFRDFRGDTIHPSTIDLIDQLGLRAQFDAIEQSRVRTLDVVIRGVRATPVDFGRLRDGNRMLALMPQWDLLSMLADSAATLPNFRLIMDASATDLLRDTDARVVGVTATTSDGPLEVRANLTVAADGRSSTLREQSGLPVTESGVPIDVLWFRVPRPEDNPPATIVYVTESDMAVTIPRTDYYQAALLIPKDGFDDVRAAGLDAFRARVAATVPFLAPVVGAIRTWDDVKLLSVQVNRLKRWHLSGFLAIGDAAHAMSPAFGVGINYAVQDAVAAANLLVAPLRAGSLTEADLARVQSRRSRATGRMQWLQLRLHARIGHPGAGAKLPSPGILRAAFALLGPILRVTAAHVIGRGFRREKIDPSILR
jgi:2-polyprenyl-6-methoxyphenol hydroxylase-like FAD-dependent oxidoreductase